ncbi:MAG: DMT family transporter [Candidatus Aminicenantes bacterium]|nr:MAG: DMT family transporter [Candidatus Aminicenantes bacterium]
MNRKPVLVYISVLLSMLFWGMSYIWIKVVYQFYNPITTVFLRLLIAAPVQFIVVMGLKKLQKIQRKDFQYLIMISLFQPFLYFLCESYGIKFVSPTIAAVITSTIPLFVPIAAYLVLKEKFSRLNILGLVVSFIGILLVIIKDDFSLSASPLGLLFLFLAVGAGVGYITSLRKMTLKYNPLTIVTYQNILGVFWFLPLFLLVDVQSFLQARPSPNAVASLVMLALLASALGFILFAYGVRELGAARTSVFGNCIPVFTAVFSWLLLKEQLSLRMILGIAVVITGLFVSQVRKQSLK